MARASFDVWIDIVGGIRLTASETTYVPTLVSLDASNFMQMALREAARSARK
jgi:hypothetical protein